MKKAVATSTFNGGLVMDFNPMITPDNVLVNALNATLVTMNGNESILQNDMGNGRVETAYLPDGYIPMGTCEFGDIIYIVSFNPLNNKCQIGCFPSPERNIDSDEISNLKVSLAATDFQELNNGSPTGKLVANSVKKIVYQNTMNPGDKYLIYGDDISSGEKTLSDYGNTQHIHNKWPKLLKIHVVSIEDSGKITYLDSYTQWYDNLEETENSGKNSDKKDYYIKKGTVADSQNEDLDKYRNKLKSNYSVFHSKVSGKLALLCELEKITGFSCSWFYNNVTTDEIETVTKEDGSQESTIKTKAKDRPIQEYQIGFAINWETEDNNINPKYIVLTQSEWTDGQGLIGNLYTVDSNGNETLVESNEDYSEAYYKYSANNKSLPIAFGDGSEEYCYSQISRTYHLEDSSTYSKFITKVIPTEDEYKIDHSISYDVQKDSIIKNIKKLGISKKPSHFSPLDDFTKDSENIYDYSTPITRIIFSSDKTGIYINPITYNKGELITETTKFTQNLNSEYYTSHNNNLYKLTKVTIAENTLPEDIINNTFGYSVIKNNLLTCIPTSNSSSTSTNGTSEDNSSTKKENYIFKIPKNTNTVDLTNLVYHYQICPAMPYGILEEYAVDGYIDFSKIGTTNIELTEWRYYNYNSTSTLTWGLSAYTEENQSIRDVTFEFIDATGPAAIMHINNKASYNGSFTNYIIFNSTSNKYIDNINYDDNIIYHKGLEVTDKNSIDLAKYTYVYEKEGVLTKLEGKDLEDSNKINNLTVYYNDSGILYSYLLYLVKITVRYGVQDSLGNYIESESESERNREEFYRWFWTNDMFNEHYYTYKDYNDIYPQLNLSATVNYSQKDNFAVQNVKYESSEKEVVENVDENYKNLAATVQYVGLDGKANLEMNITTGLANSYGVFSLKGYIVNGDGTKNWDTPVKDIPVTIYVAKKYVENSTEPTILNSESSATSNSRISEINNNSNEYKIDSVESEYGSELNTLLGLKHTTTGSSELWKDSAAYSNYKNKFYLDILDSTDSSVLTELTGDEITSMDGNTYISYDSEETAFVKGYRKYETTVGHIDTFYISYASEKEVGYKPASLDILFQGISFSKYAIEYQNETKSLITVYPLIYYESDLDQYNLTVYDGNSQFKQIWGFSTGNNGGDGKKRYTHIYSCDQTNTNTIQYKDIILPSSLYRTEPVFTAENGGADNDAWRVTNKTNPFLYKDTQNNPSFQISADGSKYLYEYIPHLTPILLMSRRGKEFGSSYRILRQREQPDTAASVLSSYEFISFDPSALGSAQNEAWDNDASCFMLFLSAHDTNNNVHILNNAFNLYYTIDKSKRTIDLTAYWPGEVVDNQTPYKQLFPISNILVSLLTQVYYTDGENTSVQYQNIKNYSYLSDHNIVFTNDIVVNITPKDLTTVGTPNSTESEPEHYEYCNNDYLLFNGIDFTTYLNMIKGQTSIVQWDEVKTNNVDVRIQRLSINSPLQVQLQYIQPTIEVINPQSIVYTTEGKGTYHLFETPAYKDKMYYITSQNLLSKVGSKTEFKLYNTFEIDNNQVITSYTGTNSQLIFHTSYLNERFTLSNHILKLNADTSLTGSSYCLEGQGDENKWSSISPIYVKDSLIYEAQTFS